MEPGSNIDTEAHPEIPHDEGGEAKDDNSPALSEKGSQILSQKPKTCWSRWFKCKRKSNVYNTFMPLIRKKHTIGDLTTFEKSWVKYSFVLYLQQLDSKALSYQTRFRSIRRGLIFLGVLISGLILVKETSYVKDHFEAEMTLFWVAMAISLTNNFVTAFLTDLKLAEQAVLYYKGSSILKAMGNTFLTCTQRYSSFQTPHGAFRTFARDVEMCKLLITNENIGLMAAGAESKPEDPITANRQDWGHLMDPITEEEGLKMGEII